MNDAMNGYRFNSKRGKAKTRQAKESDDEEVPHLEDNMFTPRLAHDIEEPPSVRRRLNMDTPISDDTRLSDIQPATPSSASRPSMSERSAPYPYPFNRAGPYATDSDGNVHKSILYAATWYLDVPNLSTFFASSDEGPD